MLNVLLPLVTRLNSSLNLRIIRSRVPSGKIPTFVHKFCKSLTVDSLSFFSKILGSFVPKGLTVLIPRTSSNSSTLFKVSSSILPVEKF